MPYSRKDIEGIAIPKHLQAQRLAELLANKVWKSPDSPPRLNTIPIITKDFKYDVTNFTIG